jgi:hypothetical protein
MNRSGEGSRRDRLSKDRTQRWTVVLDEETPQPKTIENTAAIDLRTPWTLVRIEDEKSTLSKHMLDIRHLLQRFKSTMRTAVV